MPTDNDGVMIILSSPSGISIKDIATQMVNDSHSRIPIYKEDLDHIIGIAYARDILKLNKAKVLDGYNEKYHIYDNEFGKFISNENQRRKRGIIYTIIIVLVFIFSHFISNIHIEEAAGFYPPYIEKRVVYPEFDKKDPDYAGDKDK